MKLTIIFQHDLGLLHVAVCYDSINHTVTEMYQPAEIVATLYFKVTLQCNYTNKYYVILYKV